MSANTEKDLKANQETGRTFLRSLGLGGVLGGGNPAAIDVDGGKIVRIRPFHYDWKYDRTEINAWKFKRNGKTLEPNWKTLLAPFSLAYKKRVYSPNRMQYPLKRVDWDPNGERHTENRGKSKFKRISWEEAADAVAGEIKRVHKQFGPLGLLLQADGHGECKTIHSAHVCPSLLQDKI
jgi:anaerobic selenocysteine-containing dehydrogenase